MLTLMIKMLKMIYFHSGSVFTRRCLLNTSSTTSSDMFLMVCFYKAWNTASYEVRRIPITISVKQRLTNQATVSMVMEKEKLHLHDGKSFSNEQ